MFRIATSPRRLLTGLCIASIYGGVSTTTAQPFTTTYNVPPDSVPLDLMSDTQLNLDIGGAISSLFQVGDRNGATSNIEVNITGGFVDWGFSVNQNSTVNISGGTISSLWSARQGGVINITGGVLGRSVNTYEGGAVNVYGGDFRINGLPIAGLEVPGSSVAFNMPDDSVLTGTLMDGSVFLFTSDFGFAADEISDDTLALFAAPIPSKPTTLNVPAEPAPNGLGPNQTLNLHTGGELGPFFSAVSSQLNISGGTVGGGARVADTNIVMSGGAFAGNLDLFAGSTMNLTGGTVTQDIRVDTDSDLVLNGGIVDGLDLYNGGNARMHSGLAQGPVLVFQDSEFSLYGGQVEEFMVVYDEGTLNLHGGSASAITAFSGGTTHMHSGDFLSLSARSGSEIILYGYSALLDGVDLVSTMNPGDTFEVSVRNVPLDVAFSDGTHFLFDLFDSSNNFPNYIASDAVLKFIYVSLPGDLDGDGFVGIDDLNTILTMWNSNVNPGDLLAGDTDGDGYIGIADLNAVLTNWNAGTSPSAASVPEPSTVLMCAGMIVYQCRRRSRLN